MSITGDWKRDLLRTLFSRPDEVMLDLGAGGELLVARVRAALSALSLLLPLLALLVSGGAGSATELVIGLGASIFINICAQIWLALANQRRRHGWLPFATTTYDVTTTTLVVGLLHFSDPVAPFNSIVVWCFYLFSIGMTALRNDGRLTFYAGGMAMLQYGLLTAALLAQAGSAEQLVSVDYGTVSVAAQVERLVLMLLMTLLTATMVYRMQRLIESSGSDGLTGLPNRAWLVQRMPRILETVREEGESLTLALLDLDDFKRINVDYGHLAGDRAIRHVAGSMREILRQKERLVRIGGQEFVLLLRCPIGNAWERLDRLRHLMAERPFVPERGGDPLQITFSGGLAAYPSDGGDVSSLLRSADRRLQAAKQEGCNRVVARDV
ncbi:GGDEF domain-containing protein [Lysobacter hankyongensis]|uniref:diguanylate cyclase n=1 Tax=Lysobacter hankyongensis TaxID=1176535 RepID=A0ABP9AZ18_9GAMM